MNNFKLVKLRIINQKQSITTGIGMNKLLIFITKLISPWLLIALLQGCGSGNNTPQPIISASVSNVTFSNEFLHTSNRTLEVTVNFQGNGLLVGYAPDTQPANWLNFQTINVTNNSATLVIKLVNAEFLAANNYNTTLRLATGDPSIPNLAHVDINVSLLVWQLDANTNLVSFGGIYGATNIPSQTVSITSIDNQWLASVDANWLSLDKNSGTGSGDLVITPDISQLDHAGLYQANLTLTEKTSGDQKVIPIELGLDNIYLFANQANIAFVATANKQQLSKTIKINSNSLTPVSWTATTDATWLSLAPSANGNELTITADPASIPINSEASANIIISDSANSTTKSETVKVNLYRSDQLTSTHQITNIVINNNAMAASPLHPLVYVGVNNELRVYQQYTGELIKKISVSPQNSLLEQFVIHPDGHLLLAQASVTTTDAQGVDTTTVHRYQIDLTKLTSTELTNASISYDPVKFVRFSGRYFVVTHALEYADENLQLIAWQQTSAYYARAIDQAIDTGVLFAIDGSTEEFKRYTSTVNDFTSSKLTTALVNSYHPESMASGDHIFEFMVDSTGANLYLYSPTSEWVSFDGSNYVDHGLLETNANIVTLALAKNNFGQTDFVRFDPSVGFKIDVYDQHQTRIASVVTGTLQPSNTVISADQQRVFSYSTNSQTLSLLDFN